ncbi:MAG: tRNA threonylcarbamoyladenosine dehydratase [Coriobacteriia bacterium]|nr:tRNA threonylcarbamoyladenosine dehydratase [Coriobacteriia bacterium]
MSSNDEKYSRLEAIYSEKQLKKFKNSHIAVIGLGGVGSFCASALARSGVGTLTIIDFDKIEASNINRQLFATESTIGELKTDAAQNYLREVNSALKIIAISEKINSTNLSQIKSVDYIVDAIDDVPAKIEIAKFAQENSVRLISCMGTAMRKDATLLRFDDIYKTSVCPLCKNVRKLAKENEIEKLEVLYSTEPAIKSQNGELGSTSYLPPIAGLMLAGKVLESI